MGVAELGSELEYSRPTVCTSGSAASIISKINSVFRASEVPVTLEKPSTPASAGSEMAAYITGMPVPSAAFTMH